MRSGLLICFLTLTSFMAKAQWCWSLQAEVGANKQEIQSAYQLAQKPFDPQAFWRATAGGELQVGYTVAKVLTAYSGLGYAHQNLAYQSTEWATDDAGTSFLLLCNKTANGELLTMPLGLDLKILSVHFGGGMQYRYRVHGSMQKDFYAFIRAHLPPICSVPKLGPIPRLNLIWAILLIFNGTPSKDWVLERAPTEVLGT